MKHMKYLKTFESHNTDDIFYYLEKYFNVLLNAYVSITPQRHKAKINEISIKTAMETLRRECKYNDVKRMEEAIEKFNMFINPMMIDADNNIKIWKESSDGRKYSDVFNNFVEMLIFFS